MKNFNLDELTYQYLLGKVSTLPNTATGGTGGTYQYLLGKVSTKKGAGRIHRPARINIY